MTNLDKLRNIVAKINRQQVTSDLQYVIESNVYSPPYKKPMKVRSKDERSDYAYPRQLSGLKGSDKQQIRIAGNTSGGGQGTTPYPGQPTGGSYLT